MAVSEDAHAFFSSSLFLNESNVFSTFHLDLYSRKKNKFHDVINVENGKKYYGCTAVEEIYPLYSITPTNVIKGYNVIKFKAKVTLKDPVEKLNIKITIPKWTELGTSKDKKLVKKWNDFIKVLKKHEKNHFIMNKDYYSKALTLLNNGKFEGCAKDLDEAFKVMDDKIDEELKKIWDEHKDKQDEYDGPPPEGTNHGATEGAVF